MASDPRIALMGTPVDVQGAFAKALTNIKSMDALEQNAIQAPLRNQLLQQSVESNQGALAQEKEKRRVQAMVDFSLQVSKPLNEGDDASALKFTESWIKRHQELGFSTADSEEFRDLLLSNPVAAIDAANKGVEFGREKGLIGINRKAVPFQKGEARIEKEGDQLFSVQEIVNPNTGEINVVRTPISGDLVQRSTGRTTQESVDFSGDVSEIKFRKKLKFAPEISRAIAKKKLEVKQRGEVFTDLNQAEAAMPGLIDVVEKLKVLSGQATFTLGGRVFDEAAKQMFGVATKGATARDKMTSLISNQVLPLLKPIFGSQFTEREGDRLIAAFADVDSTPESRRGQLDSFLDQMRRNIESKRRELEGVDAEMSQPEQQQFQEGQTATNAQGQSIIFSNGQWVINNG